MDIRVLGGLEVRRDGVAVDLGPPRQRAVLAVLVLEAGRVVTAERLASLLWGDEAPKAQASVQAYVSRLRGALEPDRGVRQPARVLVTQPPGYRLDIARSDVDAFRFEDLVSDGRARLRAGQPADALAALDAAFELWAGPPLPELADEPFGRGVSERFEALRLTAVEAAAEARLAMGDAAGALHLLDGEAEENPFREHLTFLLAVALYRSGRQVDALRRIDRCRRVLAEGAGVELGPELQNLEADLLAHAESLDWHPVDAAPLSTPRTVVSETVRTAEAAVHPGPRLVGRDREIALLTAALDSTVGGRGGVAVLVGEPGIGKTRLAEELAAHAKARGVAVAWARNDEGGDPPFWTIRQISDQLRAAGLAEIPVPSADGGEPPSSFSMRAAVIEALSTMATPALLVVDDLHWADPDTLRLLESLAADLDRVPVMLLVTTRHFTTQFGDSGDATGTAVSHAALVDCLAELGRVPGAVQFRIDGITVDDVRSWISNAAGTTVPEEVAEQVHDRTSGNALFVREVTHLLVSEGKLHDLDPFRTARAVPPGVQFAVRRRVSRLPATTQQLLTLAAVIGRDIDVEVLSAAAGFTIAETLEQLMPAFDAGVLDSRDAGPRFSHALVADALADEINLARRAAIHAAAARALAQRAGPGFGAAAAQIAYHAGEGFLAGTGELAVEAGTRAAQLATAGSADLEAANHWDAVADALARARSADIAARVDARIEQAAALLRADLIDAAKAPLLAAIDLAGEAGLVDKMARAAAHFDHAHVWANEAYGIVDDQVVDALERTLHQMEDRFPSLRARVLGALAAELVFAEPALHHDVAEAAIAAARAAGDPLVLARVLVDVEFPTRPDAFEIGCARAAEIVELVERHALPTEVAFAGYHIHAYRALESGDLDAAESSLALAARAIVTRPGLKFHSQLDWMRAALALARGRYDEATVLNERAFDAHRRGRGYDADAMHLMGPLASAMDRCGVEELAGAFADSGAPTSYQRLALEGLAFALLEAGMGSTAASMIASIDDVDVFPDDWTTLFTATAALHVRAGLGDLTATERVHRVAIRWSGRWANCSPLNMGFVDFALARAEALLGDTDAARAHFDSAVAGHERASAPAWLARTLVHQSRFLLDSDGPDCPAGIAARVRAGELADLHGLVYIRRQLSQL